MNRIAIVGAAGSVGRKLCDVAVDRGIQIVAIDRAFDDRHNNAGVTYRTADLLKEGIDDALDGCDAVISALGVSFGLRTAFDPPPLYTMGTRRIVEAMRRRGIARLAVVSAAFVVPQPVLPSWFTLSVVPALHSILDEMRAMERIVAASGLDWTIARPGWLLDEPGTDALLVSDGLLPDGAFRCREEDLARFLIDAVVEGRWIGQRPALGAPDSAIDESPLALGKALAGMALAKLGARS